MPRFIAFDWSEWKDGVDRAYQLIDEAEKGQQSGRVLTDEGEAMLIMAKNIVKKYDRSGHPKDRRPLIRFRRPRGITQHAD